MAESNPFRWVVLSLVAGVVLAVGITLVVRDQVAETQARAAAEARAMDQRIQEREQQSTGSLEGAATIAAPFIAHIGAGRFAEAYALLAAPFRQAVSADAFARSCSASPILAGARSVTLRELREQSAGAGSSLEARGILTSTAGTVPIAFVFLREPAGPRVLTVTVAGVPVLQGVATYH